MPSNETVDALNANGMTATKLSERRVENPEAHSIIVSVWAGNVGFVAEDPPSDLLILLH